MLLDPELFLRVAARVEAAGAYLLLDEAFVDFVEEASLKIHLGRFPRLMILRSFTKFFGIPGMRLGFLLGAPELVARLAGEQEPWSVNTMAQAMGRACLADREYMSQTRTLIKREREFLLDRLAALPGLYPVSQRGELSPGETHPAGDDRGHLAGADAGPPHRDSGRQQFSGAG